MRRKVPINAIQTTTGYFDFDNIAENEVGISEIAKVLSKICRFNGHTNRFYSVASHCILVYTMMERDGHDIELCLKGLLHDAHEAYLQDMTRVLKRYLRENRGFDLDKICYVIDETIYRKLGLSPVTPAEADIIKHYDNKALFTEKKVLFDEDMDWGWEYDSLSEDEFWQIVYDSSKMVVQAMTFEEIYREGMKKLAEREND